MSQVHIHEQSFNAGELTPLLNARFAVEKVQNGCRRLRNFIPHVHGPAFRRPGLEYIGGTMGDSAKSNLRGFNFSTSTGFVLEFHPDGLGVFSNGVAVPLTADVALPYSEDECFELQIAQVNDVCYITHPSHPVKKLVRYADDDWRIEDVSWMWPPMLDENAAGTAKTITDTHEYPANLWPEVTLVSGGQYALLGEGLAELSADSLGNTKTIRAYYWNGSAWVEETSARLTWSTAISQIGSLTPTITVGAYTRWRIQVMDWFETNAAPYDGTPIISLITPFSTGTVTTMLSMRLNDGWPTSQRSVITAEDDGYLQAYVPAAPYMSGAPTVAVQKDIAGTWTTQHTITVSTSADQYGTPIATTAGDQYRLLWSGRGLYEDAGFTTEASMFWSNIYPDPTFDKTITAGATTGLNVTLTASSELFDSGHVGSYWEITHRRESSSAELLGAAGAYSADTSDPVVVSGTWSIYTYGIWEGTFYLEQKIGTSWAVIREWTSNADRNLSASDTVDPGTVLRIRITAGTGTASSSAAVPRFLLECADSRQTGLVKIVSVTSATSAEADIIKELYSTAATSLWTEGAFSEYRGYPRAIGFHGERMWFGGTAYQPSRLWGSEVADYENFRRSSLDDASLSLVPAAQKSNRINWLLSQGENLVFGTLGDEWTLKAGTSGGAITPTSFSIQRRSGYGSAYLPAVLVGDIATFIQRGNRKVRSVAERNDGATWAANDLTVLAEHLTRRGIVQMAVMNFPFTILWCVTDDGYLLGMTYEVEQNVFAWHRHSTDGLFESVAVVEGVNSDECWVTVNRDGVRSVERLDPRVLTLEAVQADGIYLDASVRYEGDAVSVMDGLDHLEGQTIAVLADGAEHPDCVVSNGAITLEREAETIVAGLRYTSELQPMRVEISLQDGTLQGRKVRVSRVTTYVHESLGGKVADSPESQFENLNYRRISTPMDSPPELYSGTVINGAEGNPIESSARDNIEVIIRTDSALPLNVGSIALHLDVYGD